MLIELNTNEAATWMQAHLQQIIGSILKCQVKLLTQTYIVIARFVPISFDPTTTHLRELEDMVDLLAGSIQEASWIKHPSKCMGHQKVANLRILCTTPEVANRLINRPMYISGSRLCIQKDIRTPGVCNKCQMYGHILRDCKATLDTCGQCGRAHQTSTCQERTASKCTPCRSNDHPTNHESFLIYHQHENSMMDRNPETISPYYLTNKEWTWGYRMNATDMLLPPTDTQLPRRNTYNGHKQTKTTTTRTTTNPPPTGMPPQCQQTLHFLTTPETNPTQRTLFVIDLTEENSPQRTGNPPTTPQ
jgi:hypothetical protein